LLGGVCWFFRNKGEKKGLRASLKQNPKTEEEKREKRERDALEKCLDQKEKKKSVTGGGGEPRGHICVHKAVVGGEENPCPVGGRCIRRGSTVRKFKKGRDFEESGGKCHETYKQF